MGHTLVTRFSPDSNRFLHNLMDPLEANKIPYGRDCDREAANRELDYHVTMFHWSKAMDDCYLPRIRDFQATPCRIRITGVHSARSREGSRFIYFAVEPGEGFPELTAAVERATGERCSSFLHITLAITKDKAKAHRVMDHVLRQVQFPFELEVDGLDLYKIWRPTKLVASL